MRPIGVYVVAAAVLLLTSSSALGAPGNPWDGGVQAETPIEAVLTTATTAIAHVAAPVICWSPEDWMQFDREAGIARNGFVYAGSHVVNLAPDVCLALQGFTSASPKPNIWCYADAGSTTKFVTTKKRVYVKRRVHGKLRRVPVVRTSTTLIVVKLPPKRQPCGGLDEISVISSAAQTVAHEAVHAGGQPNEAIAECYGRQLAKQVLSVLGAPDADYAYTVGMYALELGLPPEYYSPECRDGGALDLDLGSTVWP